MDFGALSKLDPLRAASSIGRVGGKGAATSVGLVRVDVKEWLRWATANGVRSDIRSFINFMPEALMRVVPAEPIPFSTLVFRDPDNIQLELYAQG